MTMDALRDLYQDVILDHGRNPRNFRRPDDATCFARGHNPLCGDRLTVFLTLDGDGRIEDAAFEGEGCAISVASASLMTEIVRGRTAEEARELFHAFQDMCTGAGPAPADADTETLERLEVLSGVRAYPARVKCATLSWHTLNAAVSGEEQASTE